MVEKMQKDLSSRLVEYRSFLSIKTQFNFTTTGLRKYPGLAHFLYMDRARDCLICPTLPTGAVMGYGRGRLHIADFGCCRARRRAFGRFAVPDLALLPTKPAPVEQGLDRVALCLNCNIIVFSRVIPRFQKWLATCG